MQIIRRDNSTAFDVLIIVILVPNQQYVILRPLIWEPAPISDSHAASTRGVREDGREGVSICFRTGPIYIFLIFGSLLLERAPTLNLRVSRILWDRGGRRDSKNSLLRVLCVYVDPVRVEFAVY